MIKIGIIGLGGMGRGHGHMFRSDVKGSKVVAGTDVAPKALKAFTEDHPEAKTYTDYKDMLADDNVDAVVICTPTFFHKQATIDALKSGRPVLIEKPLARTVADCRRMIDVADKAKKLLMVAQCRRFDPDWGTIRKVVESGQLGAPVLWRHIAAGYVAQKWFTDDKLGGGPLFDGAVHDHDFGNWIFGDPEEVLAREIRLGSDTAVNTASAIVQYKSGHQMVHCWSWDVASLHSLDLIGPKGSLAPGAGPLASDDLDTTKFGYYRFTPRKKNPRLVKFRKANMYVNEDQHFIDCLNGKKQCLSPASEAIKGVAVGEAICKAARGRGSAKVRW